MTFMLYWHIGIYPILTYGMLYISYMKILIKIFWHEYVIFCISHYRNQGTDFPTWIRTSLHFTWASLVAQRVKYLPAVQETWVWTLGREDPLEKGMATHSSILAWRSPWMEEPGRLQSTGSQRVRHDWSTSLHFTYRNLWTDIHTCHIRFFTYSIRKRWPRYLYKNMEIFILHIWKYMCQYSHVKYGILYYIWNRAIHFLHKYEISMYHRWISLLKLS